MSNSIPKLAWGEGLPKAPSLIKATLAIIKDDVASQQKARLKWLSVAEIIYQDKFYKREQEKKYSEKGGTGWGPSTDNTKWKDKGRKREPWTWRHKM